MKKGVSLIFAVCLLILSVICYADNPLVSQIYTADPAGRVFNGRLYVIVTHDEDTQTGYSQLHNYYLYSSVDLINWQDHGMVFNARTATSWASLAYAPDMISRNGKYYLYFPNGADSIGVAVADKPEGPYTDPLKRALITKSMSNCNVQWLFDPCIFIDDDGQAYIYFGGGGPGNARVMKVNSDMTSVSGSAVTIDAPNFFEAAYVHKRNGTYYFSYSTNSATGLKIDYMTSSNPMTDWTHRGTVLNNPWDNKGNNNHSSIVEYNNQWYIFYHNRAVSIARGGNTYQRSINLDRLNYNSDGTMQLVNASAAGVPKLGNVDAFARNEAETIDKESGIETEKCSEGTTNLTSLQNGDWVQVSNVDFGTGATGFEVRVAAAATGGTIQVVLDSVSNQAVGSLTVSNTGGIQNWQTVSTTINSITGTHTMFLKFTGSSNPLFNINWYRFTRGGATPTPAPTRTPASTPTTGIKKGDVNGDTVINIVDALMVAQYSVGLNPAGFIQAAADANNSGSIDIIDALMIAQFYVGLITSL